MNTQDNIKLTTKGYEAYEHSATKTKSDWLPFLGVLEGKEDMSIGELVESVNPQGRPALVILAELLAEGLVRIVPTMPKKSLQLATAVPHDLYHAKLEENLASRAYKERAKQAFAIGDTKTGMLLEHIAKEEDGHEEELNKRLREI